MSLFMCGGGNPKKEIEIKVPRAILQTISLGLYPNARFVKEGRNDEHLAFFDIDTSYVLSVDED